MREEIVNMGNEIFKYVDMKWVDRRAKALDTLLFKKGQSSCSSYYSRLRECVVGYYDDLGRKTLLINFTEYKKIRLNILENNLQEMEIQL